MDDERKEEHFRRRREQQRRADAARLEAALSLLSVPPEAHAEGLFHDLRFLTRAVEESLAMSRMLAELLAPVLADVRGCSADEQLETMRARFQEIFYVEYGYTDHERDSLWWLGEPPRGERPELMSGYSYDPESDPTDADTDAPQTE